VSESSRLAMAEKTSVWDLSSAAVVELLASPCFATLPF